MFYGFTFINTYVNHICMTKVYAVRIHIRIQSEYICNTYAVHRFYKIMLGNHMKSNSEKQRRKERCIMASDSEWDAISAKAAALNISKSRLVIERVLTPTASVSDGVKLALPESAQWDLMRELLLLAAVAEYNMEQRGGTEQLDQIREETEARIKSYGLGF